MLIKDCYVLTDGELKVRSIAIADGVVKDISPKADSSMGTQVINAEGMLALPAYVNGHTHSHNYANRGRNPGWTLEGLLAQAPSLQDGHSPRRQYLATLFNAMEAASSGTAYVMDSFAAWGQLSPEMTAATVQAYTDLGIKALVAPAISDIPFHEALEHKWDARPSAYDIETLEALISVKPEMSYVEVGVAIGVPMQTTEATLEATSTFASRHHLAFQTHLSETRLQHELSRKRWGSSPTKALDDLGLLNQRAILAHGVWCDQQDLDLILERQATLVHNPLSNARLGSGYSAPRTWHDTGVAWMLGTDGCLSADTQDMTSAVYFGRLMANDYDRLNPEKWLPASYWQSLATGSHAPSWTSRHEQGGSSVHVGDAAHIMLVNLDQQALRMTHNILETLTSGTPTLPIALLISDGRMVYDNGTYPYLARSGGDIEDLMEEVVSTLFSNSRLEGLADDRVLRNIDARRRKE